MKFQTTIDFIKQTFNSSENIDDFIALHEPKFVGNEKKYLNECIDSTFVSSVGKFVDTFEVMMAEYTNSKYAVAMVNGTSALHIGLLLADVKKEDEVITQALTFVATCNAISYCNATPIFIDVSRETLGLCPLALERFLVEHCEVINNQCLNKTTGKIIKACIPMHTFGHACEIEKIAEVCKKYCIALVEDAAESLGSKNNNKHTGTFGLCGVFSFNGNKVITSGGGGCLVTDDEALAKKAKHLSTTAKIPHKWDYYHDEVAYNYRMPNLNAALLVAQLENLDKYLENKRELAVCYQEFFKNNDITFIKEPQNSCSNYWLNAIVLKDKKERDVFLEQTNSSDVMTRPIWALMNRLEMFKNCQSDSLENSKWLEARAVNIPSSVRL